MEKWTLVQGASLAYIRSCMLMRARPTMSCYSTKSFCVLCCGHLYSYVFFIYACVIHTVYFVYLFKCFYLNLLTYNTFTHNTESRVFLTNTIHCYSTKIHCVLGFGLLLFMHFVYLYFVFIYNFFFFINILIHSITHNDSMTLCCVIGQESN